MEVSEVVSDRIMRALDPRNRRARMPVLEDLEMCLEDLLAASLVKVNRLDSKVLVNRAALRIR